jgi:methylenetetrahydrofolate reductase (NADPH)
VGAGGCVILTQFFLDNAYFFEFLERIRKAGIQAPVVPGILPILSSAQVRKFARLCGSTLPPAVEKELAQVETDDEAAIQYGIDLAVGMCGELLKNGVPGLHFYALNRARSVEEILSRLGL